MSCWWPRLRGSSLAAVLAVLPSVLPIAADERLLPQWIPSLGVGVGIQAREVDGSIDAFLKSDAGGDPPPQASCVPINPPSIFSSFCDMNDSDTRTADGAAMDISGQVLGPAWSSMPLRPRPYVQGGWALTFDSRTIAESGNPPSSFMTNGQEPDLHTRMRSNPEYLWYAGGGVALQMPIDFTPVFLKIGAHYMQQNLKVTGQIERSQGGPVFSNEVTKKLDTTGVGPSLGLEAEVYRFGPVALQFVADVFFTFPLSDTDTSFDVEEPLPFGGDPPSCTTNPTAVPCVTPGRFDYKGDNVHYFGVAGLRFAWVGY